MTFVLHEISVKSEELVNVNYKEHVHFADNTIPQLKLSLQYWEGLWRQVSQEEIRAYSPFVLIEDR